MTALNTIIPQAKYRNGKVTLTYGRLKQRYTMADLGAAREVMIQSGLKPSDPELRAHATEQVALAAAAAEQGIAPDDAARVHFLLLHMIESVSRGKCFCCGKNVETQH